MIIKRFIGDTNDTIAVSIERHKNLEIYVDGTLIKENIDYIIENETPNRSELIIIFRTTAIKKDSAITFKYKYNNGSEKYRRIFVPTEFWNAYSLKGFI